MSVLLGVAWGVMLAWPIAHRTRRASVVARARGVVSRQRDEERSPRATSLRTVPIARAVFTLLDHRATRRRDRQFAHELPIVTDLLGVAIGAGANPTNAVDLAARWAPPLCSSVLERVGDARTNGAGLAEALEIAAGDHAGWRPLVDALLATDRLGAPIGPSLARVCEQQRADLRRAAEAHARRVPVRLLFPLVFLVLPAFGLLTVVPVLISGLTAF